MIHRQPGKPKGWNTFRTVPKASSPGGAKCPAMWLVGDHQSEWPLLSGIAGASPFGTLHVEPGPAAVPTAFSHGTQLAVVANLGFVALALLLCSPCPAHPGREG
jgi:hypothetical protein